MARLAGIPDAVVEQAKRILFKIENSAQKMPSPSSIAKEGEGAQQNQVQLGLFPQPEQWVIEKISQIDISKMTPLDALNCLNELKEKVRHLVTR